MEGLVSEGGAARPESFSAARPAATPAGFWIRFVASVIDQMILSVVLFPMNLGVGIAGAFIGPELQAVLTGVSWIVPVAANVFAYGWFYKHRGGTPGKLLFGLRVVNVEDGTNIGYGQTAVRETIGKAISAIVLGIGFIMAGLRADKRGLHDLLASTQVIKVR